MKAKILIVDDEPDFLELTAFQLCHHGYDVRTTDNGLDGLFLARKFEPDLMVVDVLMPGIDGYSLCEVLRRQERTKSIPVLIVTASMGQLARSNALAVGAGDFAHKPLPLAELLRRVEALTASAQATA